MKSNFKMLFAPFSISSRLMPSIKIGDSVLSVEENGFNSEGRTKYKIFLDTPTWEEEIFGLKSGCQGGNYREGMKSLLSFLSAAASAYRYWLGNTVKTENFDLFSLRVTEWAYQNSDEISMMELELG